jgi:hypothetical protein
MREKGMLKNIQTVYINNDYDRNKKILEDTGISILEK